MAARKKNIHYKKLEDGSTLLKNEDGTVIGKQMLSKADQRRIAQGKKPIDFSSVTRHCWRKNKNGVPLFVQIDMDPTDLPDDFQLYPKDDYNMLQVVQLVADGKTMLTIGRIPGMPPLSVIMRWQAQDEKFREMIVEARRSRAEMYHDAIVEVAAATKETTARSSKVKIDALRFLASVNDKDRFGQQAKVAVDVSQPINIIFHTGIERNQPIEVVKQPDILADIVPKKDDDEPQGD